MGRKNNVSRQDKVAPAQILKAVFSLTPSPHHKKPVTTVLLTQKDYAIIQLDSMQNANYAKISPTAKQQLQTELTKRWGELEYSGLC